MDAITWHNLKKKNIWKMLCDGKKKKELSVATFYAIRVYLLENSNSKSFWKKSNLGMQRNRHWWTKLSEERVREIVRDTVEIETEFVCQGIESSFFRHFWMPRGTITTLECEAFMLFSINNYDSVLIKPVVIVMTNTHSKAIFENRLRMCVVQYFFQ